MLSDQGLPKLVSNCRKMSFKAEKGFERKDLDKLLAFYQIWGHELFPKLKFKSFIQRTESLCKEKRLKVFYKSMIQESERYNPDDDELDLSIDKDHSQNQEEEEEIDLDLELENAILQRAQESLQEQENTIPNRSNALTLLAEKRRHREAHSSSTEIELDESIES